MDIVPVLDLVGADQGFVESPAPPARAHITLDGPLILEKHSLYESKSHYYVTSSNHEGSLFRFLSIDRSYDSTFKQTKRLFTEDPDIYTRDEVDRKVEGCTKVVPTFFGIAGTVSFTSSCYLILITSRLPVALIAGHYIYHCEKTTTIPLWNGEVPSGEPAPPKLSSTEEVKLLTSFQGVDLTKNFYFSCTYDISRTLQSNVLRNPEEECGGEDSKTAAVEKARATAKETGSTTSKACGKAAVKEKRDAGIQGGSTTADKDLVDQEPALLPTHAAESSKTVAGLSQETYGRQKSDDKSGDGVSAESNPSQPRPRPEESSQPLSHDASKQAQPSPAPVFLSSYMNVSQSTQTSQTNSSHTVVPLPRKRAASETRHPPSPAPAEPTCDHLGDEKFVWNGHLMERLVADLGTHSTFLLPLIHGFVDQSKLSVYGRIIYITLIARRSRHFAGARFLKRGINENGYVANDVETEQIVSEPVITPLRWVRTKWAPAPPAHLEKNQKTSETRNSTAEIGMTPHLTSFIQIRGSIPLYWAQDTSNIYPKPPIELTLNDPFYAAAARHFNELHWRYGAPLTVLNLIKHKERAPRESKLLKPFRECIAYLNQFLPKEKRILYLPWDIASANKQRDQDVIGFLEDIAEESIDKTHFFHSGPELGENRKRAGPLLQHGVVRTNCIDCLDRTNAAQFVMAKTALGHQLYALGVISEPYLPFDSDVINLLTEMFHDHGDTIALQYGGSHLVNTMETYRKIGQWTSHSRDMIENLRRYYANSFGDADKQAAIDLFLGVNTQQPVGDLTDLFLRHNRQGPYNEWCDAASLNQFMNSDPAETMRLLDASARRDNGLFWKTYYRPQLQTNMKKLLAFRMNSTLNYRDLSVLLPMTLGGFDKAGKGGAGHDGSGSEVGSDARHWRTRSMSRQRHDSGETPSESTGSRGDFTDRASERTTSLRSAQSEVWSDLQHDAREGAGSRPYSMPGVSGATLFESTQHLYTDFDYSKAPMPWQRLELSPFVTRRPLPQPILQRLQERRRRMRRSRLENIIDEDALEEGTSEGEGEGDAGNAGEPAPPAPATNTTEYLAQRALAPYVTADEAHEYGEYVSQFSSPSSFTLALSERDASLYREFTAVGRGLILSRGQFLDNHNHVLLDISRGSLIVYDQYIKASKKQVVG